VKTYQFPRWLARVAERIGRFAEGLGQWMWHAEFRPERFHCYNCKRRAFEISVRAWCPQWGESHNNPRVCKRCYDATPF
jgi:hypothetical protein